jgi:hypothetical protein
MTCNGCHRDVFALEWMGTVLRCQTCITGKKAILMNANKPKVNEMEPGQFSWFFTHPPICKCPARVKMALHYTERGYTYRCYQCGDVVNLKAAMADLRTLSTADIQRIHKL